MGANPDNRNEAQPTLPRRRLEPHASRGTLLRAVHRVVRAVAILVGLPASVVAVMALLQPLTASLPLQLGVACAVSVVLPALLVSRLFLDRPKREAATLSWDVLAIAWTLFATAFVAVAQPYTKPWLRTEAQLFADSGLDEIGNTIRLVAAVRPIPKTASPPSTTPASVSSAVPSTREPGDVPASAPAASAVAASAAPQPPPLPRPQVPLPVDQLADRVAASVVTVVVSRPGGRASATGFLVDSVGVVATTRRLVEQATAVGILRQDGSWTLGAEVLSVNTGLDFALLRFDPEGVGPFLPLASSAGLEAGTEVVTFARPAGLGMTRWLARILGPPAGSLLEIDSDVPDHRLGAPVVDRFGTVLGMVSQPDGVPSVAMGPHGAVVGIDALARRLESEPLPLRSLPPLPDSEKW